METNRLLLCLWAFSFFLGCSSQGMSNEGADAALLDAVPQDMGASDIPILDAVSDTSVEADVPVIQDQGADAALLDAVPQDMGASDIPILDAVSDTSVEADVPVIQDQGVDAALLDAVPQDMGAIDAAEADVGPDALHLDMEVHTICEESLVEEGHNCFDGCDNDRNGFADSLDPLCEGSCDGNNQFCPNGQVCNVIAEKCEEPLPLDVLFPDPGLCNNFPAEHPCHDLCNQLFLSGESCFWVDGSVVGVKDEDFDGIQDEAVLLGLPVDNCTSWHNPQQEDVDGNGVGDPCDLPLEEQVDEDEDLVPDPYDNCVYAFNPVQEDSDADTVGDACSLGFGVPAADCSDGRPETQDQWNWQSQLCESDFRDGNSIWVHLCHDDRQGLCACLFPAPVQAGPLQTPVILNGWMCQVYADADSDGIPEAEDNLEGTYILGFSDNCPGLSNPDQTDSDGDGVGDACAH